VDFKIFRVAALFQTII